MCGIGEDRTSAIEAQVLGKPESQIFLGFFRVNIFSKGGVRCLGLRNFFEQAHQFRLHGIKGLIQKTFLNSPFEVFQQFIVKRSCFLLDVFRFFLHQIDRLFQRTGKDPKIRSRPGFFPTRLPF